MPATSSLCSLRTPATGVGDNKRGRRDEPAPAGECRDHGRHIADFAVAGGTRRLRRRHAPWERTPPRAPAGYWRIDATRAPGRASVPCAAGIDTQGCGPSPEVQYLPPRPSWQVRSLAYTHSGVVGPVHTTRPARPAPASASCASRSPPGNPAVSFFRAGSLPGSAAPCCPPHSLLVYRRPRMRSIICWSFNGRCAARGHKDALARGHRAGPPMGETATLQASAVRLSVAAVSRVQ